MRKVELRENLAGTTYENVTGHTARKVLTALEKTTSPSFVKVAILGLNQVYFDSLIDSSRRLKYLWRPTAHWAEQKAGLTALLEAGRLTVGSFYEGKLEEHLPEIKEIVFSVEDQLAKVAKNEVKRRHLENLSDIVLEWGKEMLEVPEIDNTELVIPILSDGLEPAFLASYLLGNTAILPLRYSTWSRRDKEVKAPAYSPRNWAGAQISGKNVLITEGASFMGNTILRTSDYVWGKGPNSVTVSTVSPTHLGSLKAFGDVPRERLSDRFAKLTKPKYQNDNNRA